MKHLCHLAVLLLVASAAAQQTNLAVLVIGKDRYENCRVERINPAQAKIQHSAGIAQVSMAALPLEIRNALGYDPRFFLAQQQAARARRILRRIDGTIYNFTEIINALKAAEVQKNIPPPAGLSSFPPQAPSIAEGYAGPQYEYRMAKYREQQAAFEKWQHKNSRRRWVPC
jgi:hypothetical protein